MEPHPHQDSPPPPRSSTILANFNILRGRRQSQERDMSPDPPSPGHQHGFTGMLRRRRSAGNVNASAASAQPAPAMAVPVVPAAVSGTAHRIRLVPHLDSRRSLRFDAITRDLKEGDTAVRIGRFTERSNPPPPTSGKIAFKSKVVSRAHAEVWVGDGGVFYIKDTKSSSGTFLNHVRLSPANTESRASVLRDGDILQLGVDYQGGTEDIYKSVKIRIEVGREWQGGKNVFNTNALKNLKTLAAPVQVAKSGNGKSSIPDCCICLFSVTIRQALFIAPCSHTFHYKCIRPLLESHHPAFSCPLCRTFADLEDDVEVECEMLESDAEDDAEAPALTTPGDENTPPSPTPAEKRKRLAAERDAGAETEVECPATITSRRRDVAVEDVDEMDEDGEDVPLPPGGPTLVVTAVASSSSGSDEEMVIVEHHRDADVLMEEEERGRSGEVKVT